MSTAEKSKPAPLETEPGKQLDDNIDDLGRKQDGTKQEQPGKAKPSKPGHVATGAGSGVNVGR